MTHCEHPVSAWRRSSYSGPNGGECLEVADGVPEVVPVRDSKNTHGPTLAFPTASWSAFVTLTKR
ncbi:DUF397 domain-containing protein [Streptomyces sp. DSM 44915]|uniref:DUF397 domain-containing protein n=1 Tax=Streptomyces chisholmiae TaxID=3075540 RepID=A0ABU2JKU7_9ACTN|nr:DUF397 domain-containing protein [Streptomyces sp. DSM 44915]MDT0264878.1 DUF397 domain-containing protein [Streptomyces sp. DSM 44915]